jgi:hypothetical protein
MIYQLISNFPFRNYTSIEKREEPLDCVDALLFWINKVGNKTKNSKNTFASYN